MLMKMIRELLKQFVDEIDAGNSNMTEKEQEKLIDVLRQIHSNELSASESYNYLGISKSTFYNYINKGILPQGVKKPGKGVVWNKVDLENFLKQN